MYLGEYKYAHENDYQLKSDMEILLQRQKKIRDNPPDILITTPGPL